MSTSHLESTENEHRDDRPLGFAKGVMGDRADGLRRQRRWTAAALEYQSMVRLDADDVAAALRWADCCWRARQPAGAAQGWLAAAAALARAGQHRRALGLAQRAAALDPEQVVRSRIEAIVRSCGAPAEALCEIAARAHGAARRFDRARELRELLLECDPGSVTKTMRVAEVDLQHGDRERGASLLTDAAARMHASGRAGAFVRLAETLIDHGRLDADATLELARIYLRRGQVAEALQKLELARRRSPLRLELVELSLRCHAALGSGAAAEVMLDDLLARTGAAVGDAAQQQALCRMLEQAAGFAGRDGRWRERMLAWLRRAAAPGQPSAPRRPTPPPPPAWAVRASRGATVASAQPDAASTDRAPLLPKRSPG
ncbi:MAG: hypothetical protein IPH07_02955 [Deltaproteobacteria bacterium]|nr:hypothetical protein [Deltaproteobacteria bacterium]MBK8238028.1 hypothetical protein [Deltaproteobacteria bacterium]MBK8718629.1 hypothetical protein [Deltaproteobacteria bacterium]MBP7291228.1 hypothetical protein [Nannocystaceae bacterium]